MIECREHHRIPVELQVFFSTTNQTEIREGTMFDISAGGCAVTSTAPIDPGSGAVSYTHLDVYKRQTSYNTMVGVMS